MIYATSRAVEAMCKYGGRILGRDLIRRSNLILLFIS